MSYQLPIILEVRESVDYPLDSIVEVPATIIAELTEDNNLVIASINSNTSSLFYGAPTTYPPQAHLATSATRLTFDQPQIDIPISPANDDTNKTISRPLHSHLSKLWNNFRRFWCLTATNMDD